jgi:hypothetical protein
VVSPSRRALRSTSLRVSVGSPHVHSSCLAPVSFAGVNVPPPAAPSGSRPGFCPLQVCICGYLSQKKGYLSQVCGCPHWLTAPVLRLFLLLLSPPPPPVVVARTQAFRPFQAAAAAYWPSCAMRHLGIFSRGGL